MPAPSIVVKCTESEPPLRFELKRAWTKLTNIRTTIRKKVGKKWGKMAKGLERLRTAREERERRMCGW